MVFDEKITESISHGRNKNSKNEQTQMKSSLGIKYPTNRDHPLHSGDIWLEGKRADEGAEGLWRIHDKLYDLSDFVAVHPGGSEWLKMTKGTDITEAFETHHIEEGPSKLLPKYFEREAIAPRNYPFTYYDNGFYKTLKRRVRQEIKKIPEKYATQSKIVADCLFASYILSAWLATSTSSLLLGLTSGIILSLTAITSHNFFHQRDNFRMYYFDFCMMSSREWRISHAMSHHLYPNTINDMEISSLEPWLYWLPFKKNIYIIYISWIYSPLVYMLMFYGHWMKSLISNISMRGTVPVTTFFPFLILVVQYVGTKHTLAYCILMFLWIIASASFHFAFVAINSAHHHPILFHDGDCPRPKEELDYGVYQLDAVSDRKEVIESPFIVITHFGDHALHHLFPTIDHGKLRFLYPVFLKTCKEFGVEWKCATQMEMIKGQYLQISRDINLKPPKKLRSFAKE